MLSSLVMVSVFVWWLPVVVKRSRMGNFSILLCTVLFLVLGCVLVGIGGFTACIQSVVALAVIGLISAGLVWVFWTVKKYILPEFGLAVLGLWFYGNVLVFGESGMGFRTHIPTLLGTVLNENIFRSVYYGRSSIGERFVILPTFTDSVTALIAAAGLCFTVGCIVRLFQKIIKRKKIIASC